jgi:hypothetical protein
MTQSNCTDGDRRELGIRGSIEIAANAESKLTRCALVDGLNVAFARNSNKAIMADLLNTIRALEKEYQYVEVVVDASSRYRIDDRDVLDELVLEGKVILCPAGVEADELIWRRAISLNEERRQVVIVTNDMFPIRRNKRENRQISNIAVSIFPDGRIYLLPRCNKELEHDRNNHRIDNLIELS